MTKSRDFELSIPAIRDLGSIYDYIAASNPAAARRLLSEINRKIAWIAESGFLGVPRDELSLGLRALPFKDRCIYFRVMGSRIYIVRILHGRQDISSEDFPESEI